MCSFVLRDLSTPSFLKSSFLLLFLNIQDIWAYTDSKSNLFWHLYSSYLSKLFLTLYFHIVTIVSVLFFAPSIIQNKLSLHLILHFFINFIKIASFPLFFLFYSTIVIYLILYHMK